MTRRVISFVFLLLVVTGPAFAQPFPQDAPPEAILKAVLQLSDEQLQAILSLQENRRATLVPLIEQIHERQRTLEAALQSEAPDPTRLGELLVSIRDVQRQIRQYETHFHESLSAILTDEQLERVAVIHAIEAAVHAAGVLRHFGL